MDVVLRLVEVVVIDEDDEIKLKAVNNCDKLVINGYKTINLNLDLKIYEESINVNLITSLQLHSCNLSCLSDDLKNLPLKELDLSYNVFIEVPNCVINGLKRLESINFSHNKLTYFAEPLCVKRLRALRIDHNQLLNIPEWILSVNAFNLQELYYSYNEIASLKKSKFLYTPIYALIKLELRNCSVRDVDVKYLKHIKSLKCLDLSNTDIKRTANCLTFATESSNLFSAPRWNDQLQILYLMGLELADLPEEISQLITLEELHLKKNQLMWLPDSFCLPSLRLLDVSHNKMVYLPKYLSKMHNLRILRLSCNSISNLPDTPEYLEELDLYDNYLDSELDILNIRSLRKLDLELNYFDTSILSYCENYLKMKNFLRDGIFRNDGLKSLVYDDPDVLSDGCTETDSESSYQDKHDVEDKFEEPWSLDCTGDLCEGCTVSDNEWTGYEEPPKRIVKKSLMKRYPSWIFEDV